MAAEVFKFKQFDVDQSGCAMKINTDGVLIGAFTKAVSPKNILDIGTGTGVIALMLAQRFALAKIDAVEIDTAAAKTAELNFRNSPFASQLNVHEDAFEDHFEKCPDVKYDLIVSNPPFYINSLISPGKKKNLAKHADANFFENLVTCVSKHLNPDGRCWLVLPLQTSELVKRLAIQQGLHLQKIISIRSYPDSDPHREIITLNSTGINEPDEEFVIYHAPNVYTQEYKRSLHPYFLNF